MFNYLDTGFEKTLEGAKKAVQEMPEDINEAYEQILNKSRDDPIMRKVLSIIVAASRPLTLLKMNIAVRMHHANHSIQDLKLEGKDAFKSRLRSWCGLFIAVHHGNIYFLHQTAREFLTDSLSSSMDISSGLRWQHYITNRQAHTVLAEICVFYLIMFDSEEKAMSYEDDERGAFIDYASKNWGIHFHEADINGFLMVRIALTLCDHNSTSHSIWSNAYYTYSSPDNSDLFTGLLVASHFGLDAVIKVLLESVPTLRPKILSVSRHCWMPPSTDIKALYVF